MHMRVMLAALALLPVQSGAQQVHKCVSGGDVSYQSEPCQDGRAATRTWDHVDYAPVPEAELRRIAETERATRRRDQELRRQATGVRAATVRTDPRQRRCDAARQARTEALRAERIGQRSMELRRKLDENVASACR